MLLPNPKRQHPSDSNEYFERGCNRLLPKQQYRTTSHAEISSLEETVAEARAIADVAHNDLKAESGMQEHQFNEFVRPIEAKQNAP
jgi:hypothetical protein